MTENQTAKDRLIQFIKTKGIGQGKFEKACGLSNGWVNNVKATIKDDKLQKIARQYPELNTVWLLTGEGEMLKVRAYESPEQEAVVTSKEYSDLLAENRELKEENKELRKANTDLVEMLKNALAGGKAKQ